MFKIHLSKVYVDQRTALEAQNTWNIWSFTFISPIVGHPVFVLGINSLTLVICMWLDPLLHWPCPDDSKNVWHLYISLMLLEISLSTLPMGVELTYPILLTLYVVRRVKLCPNNSKKVWQLCVCLRLFEINLLTLFIGVGLNYPLLLTLYVVRKVGLILTILKGYDTFVLVLCFPLYVFRLGGLVLTYLTSTYVPGHPEN